MFIGSPASVAPRIADTIRLLGLRRFDIKYDNMHLPREARARSIELYGREVIPRVRELLSAKPAEASHG